MGGGGQRPLPRAEELDSSISQYMPHIKSSQYLNKKDTEKKKHLTITFPNLAKFTFLGLDSSLDFSSKNETSTCNLKSSQSEWAVAYFKRMSLNNL